MAQVTGIQDIGIRSAHASTIPEQHFNFMKAARPHVDTVAAVVTEPRKCSVVVYDRNFATIRGFQTTTVASGTEVCFAVMAPDGVVELCSRYPWPLSDHEVALCLRAAMTRHGAAA